MADTNIKKILRFVHRCSARVTLPFFKKILVGPNLNWFQFNPSLITARALSKGFQPIFLKGWEPQNETDHAFTVESDQVLRICHKGINLFEVTRYQICIELQMFTTDLDFSDPVHLAVIKKWFQKAVSFIDYVLPVFQNTRITKAIILQGHLYDHAIIRWICVKRGIEVIAVENTFNKNRMIWDNVSGLSVNKNLAANYFWRYKAVTDVMKAKQFSEEYIKNIKILKRDQHKSPTKEITFVTSGKTIIFIGQVYTDASTLFGIYDFNSPVAIIKSLVEYVIKNNHTLIIKLHPKEIDGKDICRNRYDSLTHKKILSDKELYNLIGNNSKIIYDYANEYDTYSIIKKSDICITINSQAGLEALLYGKKVITCGQAFYNCLSATYSAQNKNILYCLLDSLVSNSSRNINMDEIYLFFYIFCEKYCIEKNERSFVSLFNK